MISAPWIFVFFVEKNKVNGKWWEQWEPQKIREEKSSEKTSCDSTAEITEGILCEVPCETENSWRLNKAIVPVLENQVFQAGITDTWFHVHPLVAPWTLHSCLHSGLGTLATANGSWTQQEKERGQVANPSSPQSRRVISYSLSGGVPFRQVPVAHWSCSGTSLSAAPIDFSTDLLLCGRQNHGPPKISRSWS